MLAAPANREALPPEHCREGRARFALGREAAAFLAVGGHRRLGFARLGDYTRERLGISARELRTLAHVASALAGLPRVHEAMLAGRLSWTKARLLADVTRDENQTFWLQQAERHTATALGELIRRADPRAEPAMSTPPEVGARPAREVRDEQDGKGGQSGQDEQDEQETIDGESPARFRLACTRGLRRVWHDTIELARRVSGEQGPVWRAADAIAAEALSGAPPAAPSPSPSVRVASPVDQPPTARVPLESPRGARVRTSHAALPVEEPPRRVPEVSSRPLHVSDAIGRPVPSLEVAARVGSADPATLDARMRSLLVELRTLDFHAGALLRQAVEAKRHRREGFASIEAYARARFGLSAGKARAMLALDRRAALLPALREAYGSGAISWVRAVVLLPVLTRANATEWIRRSREITVRRLEDEVAWALDRNDAEPDAGIPGPPGDALQGRQIRARVTGTDDIASATTGRASLFPTDAQISFVGPRSVVALLYETIESFRRPREPRSRGLARLLAHVRKEWLGKPRHRDPVFERDGWRCAVPACSARRNLHDHHVHYRSRGGGNERANRVTVCAWHHLRAIHAGLVRVRGSAPGALSWELGIGRDGRPWLRLEGERYVQNGSGADAAA